MRKRSLDISARQILKQRAALEMRPEQDISTVKKPYRMKTREFERRVALLERHTERYLLGLEQELAKIARRMG